MIYAKGQPLKKVLTEHLVEELFKEVNKYYAAGKKVVVDDAESAEAARWLSENEDDTSNRS
jgi:(E)-4-hydroxy-3-methylbut-2-enyl-diphosphate synthase